MMTLGRTIYVTGIRIIANDLARKSGFGSCNDFQIIFCARKANVVSNRLVLNIASTIDELDDYDIQSLYEWMCCQ